MNSESKTAFFRQSGWLVIATGFSGVFLMGVYPILKPLPLAELGIYSSLLRLFTVLGIAAAGLQIIMAQQAAAAVTPESQARLGVATRSVAHGLLALWLGIVLVCGLFREPIAATLKISNPSAVWITLGLVLAQLFLPFVQGLLQGAQNFAWLGWSIMLNGAGRFAGMLLTIWVLRGHATGALAGALLGLAAAALVGAWPSRALFFPGRFGGPLAPAAGEFAWLPWLKKVLPLTLGIGSVLFVMNADVLFVQSYFPKEASPFYSAVALIGVGLVTFTTPMAAVMFPKLVRGAVRAERTDSLALALGGTALLGFAGALLCTVWPSLPLRILFFNKPELWASAPLVPWFLWCMLPVTVANVLIANLLAKSRFAAVPWLAAIAAGYALSLWNYLPAAGSLEQFAAFKGVIQRLGFFSSLLLAISAGFTFLGGKSAETPRP